MTSGGRSFVIAQVDRWEPADHQTHVLRAAASRGLGAHLLVVTPARSRAARARRRALGAVQVDAPRRRPLDFASSNGQTCAPRWLHSRSGPTPRGTSSTALREAVRQRPLGPAWLRALSRSRRAGGEPDVGVRQPSALVGGCATTPGAGQGRRWGSTWPPPPGAVHVTLNVNGRGAPAVARPAHDAARRAARAPRAHRREEGLRPRAVRRVHGARRAACASTRVSPLAVQYDGRAGHHHRGPSRRGGTLHPMQAAFLEHDGLQCGYLHAGADSLGHRPAARGAGAQTDHDISRGG